MSDTFDPYHRWLGIPPEEQPPHHYRLLGIAAFESDREVIDSVAMRHIGFLQEITDGPYIKHAQQLLNELAAARRCLLDRDKKAAYDEQLRAQLSESIPAPPIVDPVELSKGSSSPKAPGRAHVSPVVRSPASLAPPAELPMGPVSIAPSPAPRTASSLASGSRSTRRQADVAWTETARVAWSRYPVRITVGVLGVLGLVLAAAWFAGRDGQQQVSQSASVSQPVESFGAANAPADTSIAVDDSASSDVPLGIPPASADVDPPPEQAVDSGIAAPPLPEVALGAPQPAAIPRDMPAVPQKIDGLLLWLDAADQSTLSLDSSGRVSTWTDKSDHGFQAKADSVESRPRHVDGELGGHAVVQFADRANLSIALTTEPLNLDDQYTMLYVGRGAEGSFLSKGSGDSSGSFAWTRGVAGLQIGGTSFAVRGDTGRETRVRVVRADGDEIGWFIDGHEHHPANQVGFGVRTRNVLRLGSVLKGAGVTEQFFQGQLAELLVYGRALDDNQRKMLEDYLSEKWLHGSDAPQVLTVELAEAIAAEEPMDDLPPARVAAGDEPPDAEMADAAMAEDNDEAVDGSEEDEAEPPPQGYAVLVPSRLEASGQSQLQVLDGGIILSDGGTRENEQYRIEIETLPPSLTGLRLEALPHESLPGTGPGWAVGGRFALSQFHARVESTDGSHSPRTIGFTVISDPRDDLANRLVDGSDDSTWTIRRRGETVPFTFLPTMSLELPEGSRLVITLVQRENLGSFRLLATSDADALAAPLPGRESVGPGGPADDRFVLFANLGGDAYEDEEGNLWQKSQKHGVRDFGHEGGMSAGKTVQPFPQKPWAETAIRGLTAFRATVPDGVYEVTLCFCEQWTTDADRRKFISVWERGHPHAFQRPFHGPGIGGPWEYVERRVMVRDGQLDIEFSPVDRDSFSILSGIIIRQVAEAAAPGRKR